jgi:hypothetical protein
VRDFWRGTPGTLTDFATRLTGSSDLFGHDRRPTASINLVTVHDGFTLNDLVSYDAKHNEANGEDNRDGNDDNRSWNCGAEGPTDDPSVVELRARQRRNFLATLLLSEGVPLLLGGDELGRTQRGNTTPTARTTRSAGSTGRRPIATCSSSSRRCVIYAANTTSSAARASSPPVSCGGCARTGSGCRRRTGATPARERWRWEARTACCSSTRWWEPLSVRLPDQRTWAVELDTADPTVGRLASGTIELSGRSLALASAQAST